MDISLAAATMPSAMMSQRMMPPKMLTSMPSTFGSESRIWNAGTSDHLAAVFTATKRVEGTRVARDALANDLRVAVNQDAHVRIVVLGF